ncbi:hypothetical protein D3C78_641540 [compost metagenome]
MELCSVYINGTPNLHIYYDQSIVARGDFDPIILNSEIDNAACGTGNFYIRRATITYSIKQFPGIFEDIY